ncbi:MAG: hypothetical protein QOI47_1984 [Actinomycetota bacterium]|nr:hypothetical protein [Actinomycetota bacterium]
MRRSLSAIALLVCGATLLGGAIAGAQSSGYSGSWTDPKPTTDRNGTPLAYLDRAAPLTGQVSHPNGISRVSAVLVPDPKNPAPKGCDGKVDPTVATEQNGTAVTFHVGATLPCDIVYQVRATVQANASPGLTGSTPPPYQMPLLVAVAIPPAPVSQVDATLEVNGNDRKVTLAWPSGSEPDLLGYVVTRVVGGKSETLGQVSAGDATQWVDKTPAPGTTSTYEVTAVRNGPDDSVKQVAAEPTQVAVDVPARSADSGSGGGTGEPPLTSVVTGAPAQGRPDPSSLSSVNRVNGSGPPTPPTTADTGFKQALQYPAGKPAAAAAAPTGDPAVVAVFDEGGGTSPLSNRSTMSYVAGGLAVLVGAFVIRTVTRRAAALDVR